jgi:hypothetical protein
MDINLFSLISAHVQVMLKIQVSLCLFSLMKYLIGSLSAVGIHKNIEILDSRIVID